MARRIFFRLAVERAIAKGKRHRDGAVAIQAVRLNGVVRTFFNKGGNVGDDIPVTHEALQIHPRHCWHRRDRRGLTGAQQCSHAENHKCLF